MRFSRSLPPRLIVAAALLAGAAMLVTARPDAARADCCLQPTNPAPSVISVKFVHQPRIAPTLWARIKTSTDAVYDIHATISLGHHVVTRPRAPRGISTTSYGPLHLKLTHYQRHKLNAALRRSRHTPVLGIQVVARLQGHYHPDRRYQSFTMATSGR